MSVAIGAVAASNRVMSSSGIAEGEMTDEQQIAAPREEIRRAGEEIHALRLWPGGVIVSVALLSAALGMVANLAFADEAGPLAIASLVLPQWIAVPIAWILVGI